MEGKRLSRSASTHEHTSLLRPRQRMNFNNNIHWCRRSGELHRSVQLLQSYTRNFNFVHFGGGIQQMGVKVQSNEHAQITLLLKWFVEYDDENCLSDQLMRVAPKVCR